MYDFEPEKPESRLYNFYILFKEEASSMFRYFSQDDVDSSAESANPSYRLYNRALQTGMEELFEILYSVSIPFDFTLSAHSEIPAGYSHGIVDTFDGFKFMMTSRIEHGTEGLSLSKEILDAALQTGLTLEYDGLVEVFNNCLKDGIPAFLNVQIHGFEKPFENIIEDVLEMIPYEMNNYNTVINARGFMRKHLGREV